MRMKSKPEFLLGFAVLIGLGACTVSVTGSDPTTGTTTGGGNGGSVTTAASSSSSTTTAAGGGGAGGSGGAGGATGGSGGGVVDAGSDAARCVDDSDAGDVPNPDVCGNIAAYKNQTCMDTMGTFEPPGLSLCKEMQAEARRESFQIFFDCIDAESKLSTPCANTANDNCVTMHWPTACQVGKVMIAGSSTPWDCTNVVEKCPAYKQADCDFIMNVFRDAARSKIFGCYLTRFNQNGAATCKTDFDDCVSDPRPTP